MPTVAVGDIHGNLPALSDLLTQLRTEVGQDDVVVFLGDYVDRGPQSKGCIDAILAFRGGVAARVVCLLGNHEEWLLRTARDYSSHSWLLGMEALDTIQSYSSTAATAIRAAVAQAGIQLFIGRRELPYAVFFDALPPDHRAFYETLVPFFESPDCICTHAGLDPGVPDLEHQPADALVWGHARFPAEYAGDKVVVYGHWNNADLGANGWPSPRVIGRTVGIDTISHGVLTAVRLPDRRTFQSARHR